MAQTVKDFENYDVTSLDYDKSKLLVELRQVPMYAWVSYISLAPRPGLGTR